MKRSGDSDKRFVKSIFYCVNFGSIICRVNRYVAMRTKQIKCELKKLHAQSRSLLLWVSISDLLFVKASGLYRRAPKAIKCGFKKVYSQLLLYAAPVAVSK